MEPSAQGAAQLNISKDDVDNFSFPIPTNIAEIEQISRSLLCIDHKIEQEEQLFVLLLKQKNALLNQLFI